MNRLIIIGALGLLLVLAILFGVRQCDERRSQAAQSKVERGQTDALQNSAVDAINTIGGRAQLEEEQARQVQEARDDINRQTDAAGVTDAGRRGLCNRTPDRRGCGGAVQPATTR